MNNNQLHAEDEGTDEADIEAILRDCVEFGMESDDDLGISEVRSLEDSGFLTRDKGLHIIMQDGSEWTVSIACYRRSR